MLIVVGPPSVRAQHAHVRNRDVIRVECGPRVEHNQLFSARVLTALPVAAEHGRRLVCAGEVELLKHAVIAGCNHCGLHWPGVTCVVERLDVAIVAALLSMELVVEAHGHAPIEWLWVGECAGSCAEVQQHGQQDLLRFGSANGVLLLHVMLGAGDTEKVRETFEHPLRFAAQSPDGIFAVQVMKMPRM